MKLLWYCLVTRNTSTLPNPCGSIIIEVLWHSCEGNFTGNAQNIHFWYQFEHKQFQDYTTSPRGQWVTEMLIQGIVPVLSWNSTNYTVMTFLLGPVAVVKLMINKSCIFACYPEWIVWSPTGIICVKSYARIEQKWIIYPSFSSVPFSAS